MEKVQVHSKSEVDLLDASDNELQTEYTQDPADKSTGDQTTGAAWRYLSDCMDAERSRKDGSTDCGLISDMDASWNTYLVFLPATGADFNL